MVLKSHGSNMQSHGLNYRHLDTVKILLDIWAISNRVKPAVISTARLSVALSESLCTHYTLHAAGHGSPSDVRYE